VAWGAVTLAIFGAVIALVGAALPWLTFQTCSDVSGFSICFPYALPVVFDVGSHNAFLPVAAPLAALLVGVGALLFVPNKPLAGLAAAGLALGGLVVAVAFLVVAAPLLDAMSMELAAMEGVSVSIRTRIGIGPYVLATGALLLAVAALWNWRALAAMEAKRAAAPKEPTPAPSTPGAL
jgi:hypothetical protein